METGGLIVSNFFKKYFGYNYKYLKNPGQVFFRSLSGNICAFNLLKKSTSKQSLIILYF